MKCCPTCPDGGMGSGKYCSRCGTRMEKVPLPVCKCGDELWPHEKYCSKCGRSRQEVLKHDADTQSKGRTASFLEYFRWWLNI